MNTDFPKPSQAHPILIGLIAAIMLLMSMSSSAAAQEWASDEASYRQTIVLDPGAEGLNLDEPLTSFPVAVRLSSQSLDFDAAGDEPRGFSVHDANGQPVPFYVENYDPDAELATLWIGPGQLTPGAPQTVYLYYGGESGTAPSPLRVFSGYSGFYTFAGGAGVNLAGPGEIASARTGDGFAGQSLQLSAGSTHSLPESVFEAGGASTISFWFRPNDEATGRVATVQTSGGPVGVVYDQGALGFTVGEALAGSQVPTTSADWTHVAVRVGSDLRFFVNGEAVGQAPSLGAATGMTLGGGASGLIDNLAIADQAVSPSFIAAAALADRGARLVSFGVEEERSSGGGEFQYFSTVVKNVTLEGWIVIVLCMVMLAIAIFVMITKRRQLSQVSAANARFETAFDADLSKKLLTAQASSVEQAHPKSTLAELYDIAVSERARSASGSAALDSGALEALRARLDRRITGQSQTLSARMVLLTIAISGGPFLGLLGTVIGVMITFAAIAAEGNVDVNAIAPGVAAALLATAAGLFVAIPALFGYNVLLPRVKIINADNRTFADTLVARLAQGGTSQDAARA